MQRNTAFKFELEDQVNTMPMEERVEKLETDASRILKDIAVIQVNVGVMQEHLRELRGDMKAANDSIADLKTQVVELRGELRTTTAELRAEMAGMHGELRTEIQAVDKRIETVRTEMRAFRTEVHTLIHHQTRWMVGTAIALVAAAFIIARFMAG